ncbi:MAG: glycosyl transferase family 8, partial [Burkholderiales bacterium]
MAMKEPIRVFVGSDRTQDLAVKVLEYSIRRHTDAEVVVTSMTPVRLPEPEDPRQGSRTLFSFTRFAIPRLCGYQGQAIYMDADMQVFKDIRGLANIPFDGKRVIVQEELPEEHQPTEGQLGAPARRVKQSSVMLLDCERLDWVPEDIIARLGKEFSYEDLLYHMCVLDEADVGYRVPFVWNSLETYVPG